ncbi:MAG: DUF116 domain-containing protein [candidate division Zixibacteria bacterium]|nr:DUF116 domain-containing protein [candidate division Zixibacteria bacterium]
MTDRHPTYKLGPDFPAKLDQFVDQFIVDGFRSFSGEFSRIDDFVQQASRETNERDDNDLRQTKKVQYLLEAVSFRIYDRLNREAFNEKKDTILILPDCLSIHEKECEKTDLPYGDVCQGCLDDCQANLIRRLGARYCVKTVFSKRKLSEQIEHYATRSESLSVVGIACIMMLADGMRTAAELNVPARGVLLNFCGCEHWNDQPFASEMTVSWLEQILEEKYGHRD